MVYWHEIDRCTDQSYNSLKYEDTKGISLTGVNLQIILTTKHLGNGGNGAIDCFLRTWQATTTNTVVTPPGPVATAAPDANGETGPESTPAQEPSETYQELEAREQQNTIPIQAETEEPSTATIDQQTAAGQPNMVTVEAQAATEQPNEPMSDSQTATEQNTNNSSGNCCARTK